MKTAVLLALLCAPLLALAQSFDHPESVEYDAANARWLVGNHGSGEVLIYSPASGTLTEFCDGMSTGPYGIEILGNVLYCCDGGSVKGYDLDNGNQVFNLNTGASFLNGITNDGANHLFVTDFSAKKIYRINVSTNAFNLMATTAKTPNGIIYDGANNRLVFATWGSNAPVQALSLLDSTVSTLATTTFGNTDGIMRDQQGNWYIATWSPNALHKFDPMFASPPTTVMTGLSQPADLGINAPGDSIAIPNSGSANDVVFYALAQGCDTPVFTTLVLPASCAGQYSNVVVGSGITGGTPPYSFAWSTGASAYQIFALNGTYTVTVSDAVGCSATADVVVAAPQVVNATLLPTPDTQGFPDCNGVVDVTLTGGTAPYTLTWSNGMSNDSLTDLCIGWYFLSVVDDAGCTAQDSVYVDFINTVNSVQDGIQVQVFPNPSHGLVEVVLSQKIANAKLQLVDISGRIALERPVSGNKIVIETSGLANGIYHVVIANNNKEIMLNRVYVNR